MILSKAERAKIKAARKRLKMTATDLANAAGVGGTNNSKRNIIAHLENTERPISFQRLELFANALGLEPEVSLKKKGHDAAVLRTRRDNDLPR